jgi:hypothetical protein
MFAMLFGSMHVSAIAHSHSANTEYSVQIVDVDHHAVIQSGDGDSENPIKGDVGQHHHCSSVLAIEPAFLCEAHLIKQSIVFPAPMNGMASLLSAPPTQPPSA